MLLFAAMAVVLLGIAIVVNKKGEPLERLSFSFNALSAVGVTGYKLLGLESYLIGSCRAFCSGHPFTFNLSLFTTLSG